MLKTEIFNGTTAGTNVGIHVIGAVLYAMQFADRPLSSKCL